MLNRKHGRNNRTKMAEDKNKAKLSDRNPEGNKIK